MQCKFNVQDKREMKKLSNSKRFQKYPTMFLSNTCVVRVNNDDGLLEDQFIIQSKYRVLPRKIYLYGKKTREPEENDIFLNYWLDVFFDTVEVGNLRKYDFPKSDSKLELCIGLPLNYRIKAFNYHQWTRKNIVEFLFCLFNCEIQEADYEQQDLFENLLVA